MAERAKKKTKAKAKSKGNGGARPARRGKAGHNGGPPLANGDIPDEVYERHMRAIQAKRGPMEKAQEEFKQKQGEFRAAIKLAKDDGCNVDAILLADKLDKQDSLTVGALYRETGRVLRLKESNLATQLKLFSDIDAPPMVNPVLAGLAAGKAGHNRDSNPHDPGTDQFVQWDSNWVKGQASIVEGMARA